MAPLHGEPGWSSSQHCSCCPTLLGANKSLSCLQRLHSCLRGQALAPTPCARGQLPASAQPERGLSQRGAVTDGSAIPCTNSCVCGGPPLGTIHPSLKSTAAPWGFPLCSQQDVDPRWSCRWGQTRPGNGVCCAGTTQPSPSHSATQGRPRRGGGPGPSPAHLIACPTACACAADLAPSTP